MNLKIEEGLFVIIIFQLLLLSFFLFTQEKGRRFSLFLMGFFFLALGLNIADGFLLYRGFYFTYPSVALWGPALALAFGPLLYFYTKSVIFRDFKFSFSILFHLVPFVVLECVTLGVYSSLSVEVKLNLLHTIIDQNLPGEFNIGSVLIFIHFVIYASLAWRLISEYKKIVNEKFSDTQRTNVKQLVTMLIFFLVMFVLSILSSLIHLTSLASWYYALFTIAIVLLFIFINQILFATLKNPHLFSIVEEKEVSAIPFSNPKYVASLLNEDEKRTIKEKVLLYMLNDKPYLDPDLSLDQLATQLQIKPRLLSQIINETLKKNFFDFVNYYRIEEAKHIFDHPEDPKITVLEVLYQVGFNSKSSFNTVFKKETGLTPSEYRQQKRSTSR
ncbi:MAG: AraC family transcriptional regulator [Chryseolinea sp.]